jgi:hypothetical protein
MGIFDFLMPTMPPGGAAPPGGGDPVPPPGGFGDMLQKALSQNTNMLGMTGLGLLTARTAEQQRQALMNGYLYGSGMDAANRKEKREEEEKRQNSQSVQKAKAFLTSRYPEYAGAIEAVKDAEGLTRILSIAQSQSNSDRAHKLDETRLTLAERADARAAGRPVEVGGSLVAPQPDGTYKPVYEAPRVTKENWVRLGDTAIETNSGRTVNAPAKADEGERLEAGMRWKDPANKSLGVEPVPGSSKEKIDGEIAGRIGLAKSWLTQAPQVYSAIKDGALSNPVERAALATGVGGPASLSRRIESGVDALIHLKTGAGVNVEEAKRNARRYLPSAADSQATMLDKLQQLTDEVRTMAVEAGKGRGGFESPDMPWDKDLGKPSGGAPTRNPPGTAPRIKIDAQGRIVQ